MKKIFVLILLTLLLGGTFTYFFENLDLEHVVDVLEAPNNQIVILQKDIADSFFEKIMSFLKPNYNLICISSDGDIIRNYSLPKDETSTFSDYDNLSVDTDGNLYIHRTLKNSDDYFVFSEEIIKIAPSETQIETLYKINYSQDLVVEYPLIEKVYLLDHHLYMVQKSEADVYRIMISQINIYNKEIHVIKDLKIDPTLNVNDILYLENGKTIFSTVKGELYQYDNQNLKMINYELLPETIQVLKLNPYNRTSFAFINHDTSDLIKVDTETETHEIIRTASTDISLLNQVKYKDVNLISIRNLEQIAGSIRQNHNHKRFIFVDSLGSIIAINDIQYSTLHHIVTFVKLLILFGLIALLIGFIIHQYEKSKGSLIVKFSTILLPLVLLIPLISLSVSFGYFTNLARNGLGSELFNLSTERASKINPEHLEALNGIADYKSPQYMILQNSREINVDEFNELGLKTYPRWYYSVIYKLSDDKIHVAIAKDLDYWATTQFIYGDQSNQAYIDAAIQKRSIISENADATGEWILSISPIFNKSGDVIGLYEVGTGAESYSYYILNNYGNLLTLNLIIVGAVLLLMSVVIYRIIQPLRSLNDSVEEISSGNWGVTVSVHTHDEIGELSGMFNKMSLFIKDYITELTKMNEIYFKFIPLKFFELLDKKSITEVELGNYSKQEMTVLYINTANYFDLVRGKTSKEQLDILNDLFQEYARSIHAQNGLVGEFRNAGVLALFAKEDEAMSTASMIMQHISELDLPVKTNISIHLGEVLLGIVGDQNRLTTAVISECVNEVTEINKIATNFDTGVLLSDTLIANLNHSSDLFRYIGSLEDSQSDRQIKLYEWLDTLQIAVQKDFIKSKEVFESALALYEEDHFNAAKRDFINVIKSNSHDQVSKEYLFKCEKLERDQDLQEKPIGRY